jgi:mannose-6-phosphate isomerase-like protein (cupin superfamily)
MKLITKKRPWGEFQQFALNERCTVKILILNPKQRLSLQSHQKRDELWVALDSGLVAQVGKKKIRLKKGQRIFIPRKTKHSLQAFGKKARVLEISFGFFDEKDEERFEDIYGRV